MTEPPPRDALAQFPARRVTSPAEVAEAVREARGRGEGVYPRGGGTKQHRGFAPTAPGIILDLRAMGRVLDYPARDMTVTVEAGATLAELQAVLAQEGQELPIDAPHAATATLGGLLATNASGPRRAFRGTPRDYLIGVSFISDEGREVKGGGRVVKNVAGYDLMKLHIGAMGTLGVLTQLTFKVTPKAEDTAFVAFRLNAAAVGPTLDRLHASRARPAMVELLNGPAVARLGLDRFRPEGWLLLVGFEEKRVTVAHQVSVLLDELRDAPIRDLTTATGADALALRSALNEHLAEPPDLLSFEATTLPSRVAGFVADAAAAHPELAIHAHAAVGVVHGRLPVEVGRERAAGILAGLTPRDAGNLVVRRCPEPWRATLPMCGRVTGDRELMRTVKRTLDPADVFNPGRWL